MKSINNIKIITVPVKQTEINRESKASELIKYMNNHSEGYSGGYVIYDLGRYFADQNKDNLGLHLAFLFNMATGEILNGLYNTQL